MKKLLVFPFILLMACLDPLEAPGPAFVPDEYSDGPPNLSFTVRASGISPGSVRFRNFSTGMVRFKWYLGFNGPDGYELTSTTPAPTLKYPKNGRYNVRLNGIGTDSSSYWASDYVEITNMAN